jgi:hypothetical protein
MPMSIPPDNPVAFQVYKPSFRFVDNFRRKMTNSTLAFLLSDYTALCLNQPDFQKQICVIFQLRQTFL